MDTKSRDDLTKKRNVYFFRIDAGADDNGVPLKVDLSPAVQRISKLPFADTGRYQSIGVDGDRLCV